MKGIFNTVIRYIKAHPVIAIVSAAVLAGIIAVIIVSCSSGRTMVRVDGPSSYFDDQYWQTDENGFTYYACDGYLNNYGIDISEWVGEIDFRKVKKAGIDFVILRVGYRGYETGKFVLDNNLSKYLKEARSAGLGIGAYFVSQAINEEEAAEEAEYVMEHVRGYEMELPLYIDLEAVYDTARTDHLTAEDYTKIAETFCSTVEAAGYRGGIYANNQWFHDNLIFDRIQQYDIWMAQYSEILSTDLPVNMWQFTNEGLVDGCEMWVDLNVRVFKETEEE